MLALLSSSYGITQAGDAKAIVTAYELALAQLPEQDIDAAFDLLVAGTAPGQNPNFMPAAPFVGALARNIRDGRLQRLEEANHAVRQLLARDVVKEGSEESRVDVVRRALRNSVVHGEEREATPEDLIAKAQAASAYRAKHDAHFGLDRRTPDEVLHSLGYEVGDDPEARDD